MPPGATQKCDACAILEFLRPDSSRRSKGGHSSVFFKSSFDYSSGNMAEACTIRRNKRSFYRRVHVDKLATLHSPDLMNVISRLYGDTMPLRTVRAVEIQRFYKQESISVTHRRLGSSSWYYTERPMQVLSINKFINHKLLTG